MENISCARCGVKNCECNPYILRGYRPTGHPIRFYILSVLRWNNETFNFWTHFIPFLLFAYRSYNLYSTYGNSMYVYPFYAHALGVCYLLLSSSLAHMLASYSGTASRCCYAIDHAAIYSYGVATKIPLEYYLCPTQTYCEFFTPVRTLTLFAIYGSLALSTTFYGAEKGIPFIKTMSIIFYVIGSAIIYGSCSLRYFFFQVADFFLGPTSCSHVTQQLGERLAASFFFQLATLAAGLVFFASKIPERFSPGRFDVVGNSHQIFHLFTALTMFSQSLMLESVVQAIQAKGLAGHFATDSNHWMASIGQFLLSVFLTHIVVLWYWVHLRRNQQDKCKCS